MTSALPDFSRFRLVVIGCSAGGIDALSEILPGLPLGFPASVAVAIHLPATARSLLAEIYSAKCALPVKEAEDKEPFRPGHIYFAPAGYHLLIEADLSFSLSLEDPVNFSRPSIDVLFESAAVALREKTLGILLTGASHDGAAGLKTIGDAAGFTIVQNPKDALHSTMPQSAIALASPGAVLSVKEIREYFAGKLHE